jgi:ADP-ribose diphosphatase
VREYAVGLDRYELSLPTGRIETGEDVQQAANRELAEETGYRSATIERLHTLSLVPGILGYQAEIVLARNLEPAALQGDEAEVPEVLEWPLHKLDHVLRTGEITEARTLAALFLARERLRADYGRAP